jgi:hypothetical protein
MARHSSFGGVQLPPNLYLAKPQNADVLAGRSRRVHGHYQVAILLTLLRIAFLLAVFAWMPWGAIVGNLWLSLDMSYHGKTVSGVVTDISPASACGSEELVAYRYIVVQDGQQLELTGQEPISRTCRAERRLKEGSLVLVRYLVDAPRTSSISWHLTQHTPERDIAVASVPALVLLGLLAMLAWQLWARRRLRNDTRLILGEVISSKRLFAKLGSRRQVTYCFRVSDHEVIRAQETIRSLALRSEPRPGASVVVIYASPWIFQLL